MKPQKILCHIRLCNLLRDLCYNLFFIILFLSPLGGVGEGFLLTSCSSSSEGEGEGNAIVDRITDEKLAQHKPAKKFEMNGKSEAIKLRPRKEMRITAKKGAFERTPDIQVTDLTEEQMDKTERLIRETFGEDKELLWAYDIDAGLPFDSVIPGVYTVELNLKLLGVPNNLWPYIRAYRSDGNNRVKALNIFVNDKGVLRYEARQNSIVAIGLALACYGKIGISVSVFIADKLALLAIAGGVWGAGYTYKAGLYNKIQSWWDACGWPENWWKRKDWVTLYINDPMGNFYLHFRYSKTEKGDQAETVVDQLASYGKRAEELKGEAKAKFNHEYKNNAAYKALNKKKAQSYSPKSPLLRTLYIKHLEKMTIDSIYYASLETDNELKTVMNLIPKSVQDVINGMRVSERFCQADDGLALKRLPYECNVYIVPNTYTGQEPKAVSRIFEVFGELNGGVIFVNADELYQKSGSKYSYSTEKTDEVLVSMAHELSHLYEYTYINAWKSRDNRFIECIGSVSEYRFTDWLKKHNYITYDPNDGNHDNLYADRKLKEVLAWPLVNKAGTWPKDLSSVTDPDIRGGYMLGGFFEYLCEQTKQNPSFEHIMNHYSVIKTLAQDFMDIFGITTETQLQKYFEGFCIKYLTAIVDEQKDMAENPNSPYYIPNQRHTYEKCVMRLRNIAPADNPEPLAFKGFKIICKEKYKGRDDTKRIVGSKIDYRLFAVPSPVIKPSELKFSLLDGSVKNDESLSLAQDPYSIKPDHYHYLETYGMVLLRPGIRDATIDGNYYIDLVAFYQPYNEPKVQGRSKDGTGLNVRTMSEPPKQLVKYGYISGMQIAVKNNLTGKSKTFNVPLNLCGKTVKIEYEKIGIADPNDIDISLRSRWYFRHPNGKTYYSPATERVNYKKKKEQVVQKKDEKENSDEEIKENNDEEVDEDFGSALVNARIHLEEVGYVDVSSRCYGTNYLRNYTNASHFGRLIIKDGTITIILDSQTLTQGDADGTRTVYVDKITFKAQCDTKRYSDGTIHVSILPETLTMKPNPFTANSNYTCVADPSLSFTNVNSVRLDNSQLHSGGYHWQGNLDIRPNGSGRIELKIPVIDRYTHKTNSNTDNDEEHLPFNIIGTFE